MDRLRKDSERPPTTLDFADKFPSEQVLQQALVRLLSRIPNHTGVQILQGSREIGKDIIFYTPAAFGQKDLNACVVKNAKITGSATAPTGARTVFIQAQQAFDTPVRDENGQEQVVKRVFIITPYPIPPETVDSIVGALKVSREQIQFIGGARLLELFKDHWPDYLAEEFKLVREYAEELSEAVATVKELKALSFQHQLDGVEISIQRVYVQPNFHRILRSYSLRPFHQSLLEKFDNRAYNEQTIDDAKTQFDKISAFVGTAVKWGLCDEQTHVSVRAACSQAANEITAAWSKALASLAARTSAARTSPAASEAFSARLADIDSLNNALGVSKARITKALRGLDMVLEAVKEYSRDQRAGDSSFVARVEDTANRLDDVTRIAGAGLIVEEDEQITPLTSTTVANLKESLLIVAPAGFGKTSFCRWHALNDLERLLEKDTGILPVYVPLHQLRKVERNFHSTFLQHATISALLPKDGSARYEQTRVYLDGLDEIPDPKMRIRVAELARQGTASDPKLQVIITARDYVYGPWMAWLPRIRLSGLDDKQIEDLAAKWLDNDSRTIAVFFEQLNKLSSLKELMTTPLLATLIVQVFKQTHQLPENKTRLYEIFVDLHNGGWDLAKGIQRPSRFSAAEKMFVLKRIAFRIHDAKRREMLERDAAQVAGDALKSTRWEALRDELARDGLLFHQGKMVGFAHHSFQEFLTARHLLGERDTRELDTYCDDYLRGSDWWQEVLCFYIDLASRPQETRKWLTERVLALGKREAHPVAETNLRFLIGHLQTSFPYAR